MASVQHEARIGIAATIGRLPKDGRQRVVVSGFHPEVDGGRFAAKRIAGEPIVIEADVYADGHDVISAVLLHRAGADHAWKEEPLVPLGNDRWRGSFTAPAPGFHEVSIEAWIDPFATWRRDLEARLAAGQDVAIELRVGARILRERAALALARNPQQARLLRQDADLLEEGGPEAETRALEPEMAAAAALHDPRDHAVRLDPPRVIDVDRPLARDGAWYELFPRSHGPSPEVHGTLRDVEKLLPRIASLGFDVLYLPPIHPIGRTHRKGRNNARACEPGDPGSPWGIGGPEGGHEAVHPRLGTLADLRSLVRSAQVHGLEIALDLALQCSPDHPWVVQHPDWFRHRPDGTIRHAENPPKKYEDIYPLDFECDDWRGLWQACLGIVLHWIDQGVRIFRVDNPHGKPLRFWEWLIRSARERDPGAIFLSEAFTRQRIMEDLAKRGFAQSYTYFTWRTGRLEIEAYARELFQGPAREYFRPAFWPNTPDILHETLQAGGRPAFALRAVLAATLSSTWGVYGPAYEACESRPVRPGSEEYLDSEKYQLRWWDPGAPGSLAPLLGRLNAVRRAEPAFRGSAEIRFLPGSDESITCFSRVLPGHAPILVAVNLEPAWPRSSWIEVDPAALGLGSAARFRVLDLLDGGTWEWQAGRNYVALDPARSPAHVFRVDPLPAEEHGP